MLLADSLTKTFGPRVAVERVSFDVHPGEIFALVGPNGAGKTTTLRMLAGLIPALSGRGTVSRTAYGRQRTHAARRHRLPYRSARSLDRLTVRQNLHVHARLHGLPRPDRAVDAAMDLFGIADRAAEPAAVLSKGCGSAWRWRARCCTTRRGAARRADVGLDPESARDVRELVLRCGTSGARC
jgi:ABC-2 type transport system ATP-binding protein